MNWHIEQVTEDNFEEWLRLGIIQWQAEDNNMVKKIFEDTFIANNEIAFLCKYEEEYIGFANISIKYEHIEGSKGNPLGYLDLIYVTPEYRNKGVAKALLKKGEEWIKANGCNQIGSATQFDNVNSFNFHMSASFTEANRMICFIKDI